MSVVPAAAAQEEYVLRLYVAGMGPRSVRAVQNLTYFCERRLAGRYRLEVVDLLTEPERAATDDIIALPTLVRAEPGPVRKIIGDLSDSARLLAGLDLADAPDAGDPPDPTDPADPVDPADPADAADAANPRQATDDRP